MKIAAIILTCLLCSQAWAKPPKDVKYQDAVLVSFNRTGTGAMDASRIYTIQVGSNTYVLEPLPVFLYKSSVLMNQLPGTHLLVRTDGHSFYVKIGNRESHYGIVEAH